MSSSSSIELRSIESKVESGLSTPMFSSKLEFMLRGVSTSLLLTTEVGPISYSSGKASGTMSMSSTFSERSSASA